MLVTAKPQLCYLKIVNITYKNFNDDFYDPQSLALLLFRVIKSIKSVIVSLSSIV